jgi:hypothetical protein
MLDEVGELLNHLPQPPFVEELFGVVLEVQGHVGAAGRLRHRLDRERPLAVRLPTDAVLGLADGARDDRHLVGNHERRVEADTELADQFRPLADLLALQVLQEGARARLGDRAELVDDALARHADAVVGDGQRLGVLVGDDPDHPVLVVLQQLLVLERVEFDLVDGIAGVGDQFTEEDFAVGVEGVSDDVQQLLQLGLELKCFRRGRRVCHGAYLSGCRTGK